ncbi:MAG: phage major capsid protein [Pseudomonadota bacterium]|nr:phage major capsid protein [Pseudomonadota bacterium]
MPDQTTPTTTATKPTPPAPTDASALPVLRQIEGAVQHRNLEIDGDTIDKDSRTVEVAVSSEYPVRRYFGMEVLEHTDDAIDLRRLKAGAPLLDNHRSYLDPIGVVEDAWLDGDRRMRARVRFGKGERAEEVWQAVLDGIRRNISTGYLIHEMVLERADGDLDHYRVTRWEPYEVSSVTVPADPTVGVGRSATDPTNTITIRGKETMADNAATTTTTAQASAAPKGDGAQPIDHARIERERCADIMAAGEQFGRRDLAQAALEDGTSLRDFMRKLRDEGGKPEPTAGGTPKAGERDLPNFQNTPRSLRDLGVSAKEASEYSLLRAIEAQASNDWDKAGLERNVSLAIADSVKKEARGFFVPHDVLARSLASSSRGMSKGEVGKGGELIATDLRVDQFIDILRNEALLASLGIRILGGLQGEVDLPKKTKGAGFSWIKEGDNAPLSDMDLSTLRLTPKTIAGGIPLTRKLRLQSSMSVEALIVQDLVEGLAVAMDYAMLAGTGIDDEPLGLLNMSGLNGMEYTDNISWADVVALETKARQQNVRQGALHYLTSVVQDGYGKTAEKFASTGKTIIENGRSNGYGVASTNQMPDDAWLFGDFSQLVAGMWGVMDIKPDTATLAGSDGLILRVFQDADVGCRRPGAFSLARKATAAA